MNYTTETLPGSEVRITIPISADTIRAEYDKTLKSLVSQFEMDGFRKGAVPEKIVIQRIGSLKVWEEALKDAIPSAYIAVLTESKIPAIGRPHFAITKIADQSDAVVVVTTAIIPDFTAPDFTAISKSVYSDTVIPPVTDDEVSDAVLELRQLRHKRENHAATTDDDSDTAHLPTNEVIPEADLPELTPEYLAGFGPGIDSVETLKAKLKHNLEHERIHQFEDKKRAELTTKLCDACEFDVPAILAEHEIDVMLRQYEHDLSMSGISLDDYLTYTNKTRSSLRDDVRESAIKRAKTQLIIEKISESANIKADPTKVEQELSELQNKYKDNTDFDREHAKTYLEQVFTNQAVFSHLEQLAGYTPHNHAAWSDHNH
jgi:FKBP-type peptidyl-prolyl cis-trans isomerase (trigger factor)